MDFVEQVKTSVDIVGVIGEYVRLKKLGTRYVGLCPFHTEKTPSFSVHAVHQFYKCFGCGAGGDLFRFIMEIEGVTFFEALKMVAERNGIAMPRRSEYSDPAAKLRGALHEMHDIAARVFQANLMGVSGAAARQYLAGRGLTRDQAADFGLGLADDGWNQLTHRLESEGFTAEQIEQSGLANRRDSGGFYDRFRGRLMFPIGDESGKVIAFGGRALKPGEEPKYLNSPETPLYRKSNTLYNLQRARSAARKLGYAVLVEGYMDVIGVYGAGVQNVVASCGTALTAAQVRALKRHTDRVVVNFDPDSAGSAAAERSIHILLEEGLHVRVLKLADGLDPDEYVKKFGADRYRQVLENAQHYYFWLADQMRARFDLRAAEGRMEAWNAMLPAIERIGDTIERAAVAKDMASYLGVDEALVLERFRKGVKRGKEPARPARAEFPAVERLLLHALLVSPDACSEVLPRLRGLPVLERLRTKKLLDALYACWDAGEGTRYSDVAGRLADSERELLSNIVFADEAGEDIDAIRRAMDCLQALERQSQELARTSLEERIRDAERKGDLETALRLAAELNGMPHTREVREAGRRVVH